MLTYAIALVWLTNGLLCKIFNLVPRHEQIVARILGQEHARLFTLLIGVAELFMGIWILSAFKAKFVAIAQIIIVLTMNIIELSITPDLLLWGKFNIVYASIFSGFIYYNAFVLDKRSKTSQSL